MAVINDTTKVDLLTGTVSADTIFGFGGDDILVGLGGNDKLDGGTGNDILKGGAGKDSYVIDSVDDQIDEEANVDKKDTVKATISANPATMFGGGSAIENLTLITGAGDVDGTGNDLNNILTGNALGNIITGNDAHNILEGAARNDTLISGLGHDTLKGGLGTDTFHYGDVAEGDVEESVLDFAKAPTATFSTCMIS